MTGFAPAPQEDPIAAQAAEWFVRLHGEAASGDDWAAFEAWLQASPAHARAYERLERVWMELDEDRDALAEALRPPARPSARARPRWAWPAAAAALAASLAVAMGLTLTMRPAAAPAIYETRPGQLMEVALADGTRVRLNAATRLSVVMERHARRVEMADGEAVFDVAHDPARPFLIEVGDRQVKVVGTEFDLRHRDGRMEVTVRRGVVEVRPAGAAAARPARVTVGQQYAHRDGDPGATVAPADVADAFDWTQGQLIYRDRPLSEVAADISRRFGVDVRPADPQTAAMRFTGVLVTDSAPQVLKRLQAFTGVTAETAGGTVLLHKPRDGR